MGQYRHVTDLADFVSGINYRAAPLRLTKVEPLLGPVGGRLAAASCLEDQGLVPLRPVPAEWQDGDCVQLGNQVSPDGKPVIEWSIMLKAARHACIAGAQTHQLDDYPGEYVRIVIGGDTDLVVFDEAFKAAKVRGDVVERGEALFIRVDGAPLLN